jgi:hypothetical protein
MGGGEGQDKDGRRRWRLPFAVALVAFLLAFTAVVVVITAQSESRPPSARADVTITRCVPDGNGGDWQSFGRITNHTTEVMSYRITVGYFHRGRRIGSSEASTSDVPARGHRRWASQDVAGGNTHAPVECRVLHVDRRGYAR